MEKKTMQRTNMDKHDYSNRVLRLPSKLLPGGNYIGICRKILVTVIRSSQITQGENKTRLKLIKSNVNGRETHSSLVQALCRSSTLVDLMQSGHPARI